MTNKEKIIKILDYIPDEKMECLLAMMLGLIGDLSNLDNLDHLNDLNDYEIIKKKFEMLCICFELLIRKLKNV